MTSSTDIMPEGVLDDLVGELEHEGDGTRRALTRLLEAAIEQVGANESSIMLPSGNDHLKFFASTNPRILEDDIPLIPVSDSIAGVVFLTGQSMVQAEGHNPDVDRRLGYATREYMALPIVHSDRVAGVLTFVNRPEGKGSFTKDEILLAETVSELCEPLIEHLERSRENAEQVAEKLRHLFAGGGVAARGSGAEPVEAQAITLRAEIAGVLKDLDEGDLQLVRDIVERLAGPEDGLVG